MKTKKLGVLIIACLLLLVIGCSDDDSVKTDSVPEINLLTKSISSLPGETFVVKGTLVDPAGIQSVNLKYEPWFLDKTITKNDSVYKTYELDYKFKVPEDAIEGSEHLILITVINQGGNQSTENLVVTLDQDIASPIVQVNSPTNGTTVLIGEGNEIEFDIVITDQELAEFKIESTMLNETIPVSGTSYNYMKSLDIEDEGRYDFTITVADASGNLTTETLYVNVLNELLFDAMYLADVSSDAELNTDLFGVPYATEASTLSGEDGYVFTARYYAATENVELRFIPQKGSFEPYTFGASQDQPGVLDIGSDNTVTPIVLPQIGYYEVIIDVKNLTYTVNAYIPTDDAFDQVYILGRGVFVGDSSTCVNNTTGATQCWHFNSGKPFNVDSSNPYLWTLDISVDDQPGDEGANGFILNSNASGWAPFWRVDNAADPEATVPGGGTNYVFPDDALGKDYKVVFDTHLNRLSFLAR
ncbi:hypothetical protein [Algibacter sp. PT7-4]|uniref:hypothetical protein n=1 Tax=Algibacter ulvanivorans TaxID=3400999 RepID=UPI003AAC499A